MIMEREIFHDAEGVVKIPSLSIKMIDLNLRGGVGERRIRGEA